uniref:Auxin-responsive protein n=1 Tax=Oryza punctata TaxID=4537 RepID=A0A0E0LHV9_ORYPU
MASSSLRSTSCLASAAEADADNLCLRLGPPGSITTTTTGAADPAAKKSVGAKRSLESTDSVASGTGPSATATAGDEHDDDTAAPAKAQVVGWPPVRAYRRNTFHQAAAAAAITAAATKKGGDEKQKQQQGGGLYVKVSMDGAPYLRKVDLKMCKGYRELREALDLLFTKCFSATASDGCSDGQFAIAYEDKDGDLMLVGDVPWEMFISSCKKLRIMKGSEARGQDDAYAWLAGAPTFQEFSCSQNITLPEPWPASASSAAATVRKCTENNDSRPPAII